MKKFLLLITLISCLFQAHAYEKRDLLQKKANLDK